MLTKETAVMLARYNNWADQVLFKAIREQLPSGIVYQKRKTLFKSIIGTLNHNHQVDLIWRAHLLEKEHDFATRRDLLYPDFDELVQKQLEINQWYINWAAGQDEKSFTQRSKFSYVNGTSAEMSFGGMFLHIINHKTYHRGWVSEMFFEHNANPPETDICIYLCQE